MRGGVPIGWSGFNEGYKPAISIARLVKKEEEDGQYSPPTVPCVGVLSGLGWEVKGAFYSPFGFNALDGVTPGLWATGTFFEHDPPNPDCTQTRSYAKDADNDVTTIRVPPGCTSFDGSGCQFLPGTTATSCSVTGAMGYFGSLTLSDEWTLAEALAILDGIVAGYSWNESLATNAVTTNDTGFFVATTRARWRVEHARSSTGYYKAWIKTITTTEEGTSESESTYTWTGDPDGDDVTGPWHELAAELNQYQTAVLSRETVYRPGYYWNGSSCAYWAGPADGESGCPPVQPWGTDADPAGPPYSSSAACVLDNRT